MSNDSINNHHFELTELTEEIREQQALSDEKVEAITARWSELETIEDPRNLNDALETQKHNIAEVVALKDRTIQLLRDEIERLHKIFYDYSDQQVSVWSKTNVPPAS